MKPRSIENLKKYVKDQSYLKSDTGKKIMIQRCGNNIIKIHNRPVSWKHLQELVCNGSWELYTPDGTLIFKNTNKGGVRPNAGAKKKADTKKPVSFGLTKEIRTELETLCKKLKLNRSELIADLIREKYKNQIRKGPLKGPKNCLCC